MAADRCGQASACRDSALYPVFKWVEGVSGNWRGLHGGKDLMILVLEGCVFKDGVRDLAGKPALFDQ